MYTTNNKNSKRNNMQNPSNYWIKMKINRQIHQTIIKHIKILHLDIITKKIRNNLILVMFFTNHPEDLKKENHQLNLLKSLWKRFLMMSLPWINLVRRKYKKCKKEWRLKNLNILKLINNNKKIIKNNITNKIMTLNIKKKK